MSKRIELLDVLRFVAVLMVMLYHFYHTFLGDYTNVIRPAEIIKYGYLGVELFFIISGFVITLTLEKCENFREFMTKRFIRLMPGMILCSVITFLFVLAFDTLSMYKNTNTIQNLLVSNTFISPKLLNNLFQTNFNYIDGAYWSLWVEIIFYIIAGILFFIDPKKILRNYSVVAFISIALFFITVSGVGKHYLVPIVGETVFGYFKKICEIFTFCEYGLWFLLGMILKGLFYDKHNTRLLVYFSVIFLIQTLLIFNFYTVLFSLIIYIFLLLFIFKPEKLSFLNVKLIQRLGLVSYSTYLLHGKISSIVLKHTANYTSSKIVLYLTPLLLVVVISFVSIYLFKAEGFISKYLKSIFLKTKTVKEKYN